MTNLPHGRAFNGALFTLLLVAYAVPAVASGEVRIPLYAGAIGHPASRVMTRALPAKRDETLVAAACRTRVRCSSASIEPSGARGRRSIPQSCQLAVELAPRARSHVYSVRAADDSVPL